jgi:hypothetical protein
VLNKWWPKKERGFASGLATAFSGVAQVVTYMTILLCMELNPEWGWRAAFRWPMLPMVLMLVVFFFIGLFRIPQVINLTDRLMGRIPYTASCTEIVRELEGLGITGFDDPLPQDYEYYFSTLSSHYNNRNYKIPKLLEAVGYGYFYEEGTVWHPNESGVFYFSTDVEYVSDPYTYLLKGIASLDPELNFRSITESYEGGIITVTFRYKEKTYTITEPLTDGIYFSNVLGQLDRIIAQEQTGKHLYYTPAVSDGILIFYRDAQWAKDFQYKTGLFLVEASPR